MGFLLFLQRHYISIDTLVFVCVSLGNKVCGYGTLSMWGIELVFGEGKQECLGCFFSP